MPFDPPLASSNCARNACFRERCFLPTTDDQTHSDIIYDGSTLIYQGSGTHFGTLSAAALQAQRYVNGYWNRGRLCRFILAGA